MRALQLAGMSERTCECHTPILGRNTIAACHPCLAIPYTTKFESGLLEQGIEYDLAGRVNPYGFTFQCSREPKNFIKAFL